MKNHLKLLGIIFTLLWLMPMTSAFSVANQNHSASFTSAATDTTRVEWKTNRFPNPGFELWYDDTSPNDLGSDFTREHYAYFNTNPLYVNEGTRSFVIQARADNPVDYSEAVLRRSSWSSWSNPTNLTLKFDWFVDALPSAVDYNYLRMQVRFATPGQRNLFYYFESHDASLVNDTFSCYFEVSAPLQSWNIFDRNLTEDYFEAFGSYPTYQFYTFEFQLRSYTNAYCRAYFDDIWLVNGTTFIGGAISNGNFESFGTWQTSLNSDQGLISKSTTRLEGDYSLNATATSNGNASYARLHIYDYIRASSLNPDQLGLKWRIDELVSPSANTYAYLRVSCKNGTDEGELYLTYGLFYMGDSAPYPTYGGQDLLATGFNETNQWHSFDKSIWEEVASVTSQKFIIIEDIEIEVYSRDPGARITILFDDASLITAALCDMGYEDQAQVGSEIWTWNLGNSPAPNYTVTDNAHSGSRAARLALENGEYFYGEQYPNLHQLNENTDLWLDLFWRIEDWSADAGNILYIEVYFDEQSIAYILANNSAVPSEDGFDEYFLVSGHNTQGVWNNLQRNLYDDYESAFGVAPDTYVYSIILYGEADAAGNLEVLFDDVYLYNDPAPEISGISFTPTIANTKVNVSAQVYDPSLATVKLVYQIDGGAWMDISMVDTGNGYNGTIPSQVAGTSVLFYVEATDAFEQTSQSTSIGYEVTEEYQPPPPDLLTLLIAVGVGGAAVVVILVYILYIKPKQSGK
jgi:hypothetical protein